MSTALTESEQLELRQRARVFALSNLVFDVVLLLVVGIGDIFASGSWFFFGLLSGALVLFLLYYWSLPRVNISWATVALTAALEVVIALAIVRTGGVLTAAPALFTALILGAGLVLVERSWIFGITALSVLVYLTMVLLQFTGVIVPDRPGPEIDASTSTAYKVFVVAVQTSLFTLVGMVTGAIAHNMRRRARVLEETQQRATQSASSAQGFAEQLNEKVLALRETEDRLRDTVEQLSVPVLPLREGVVVMPLVGYIDQQRALLLTQRLLRSIHERNSHLVIIDLTAITEINDVLSVMLMRMTNGVRLLGAELVAAGLQPAVARMLSAKGGDRLRLRSFQSLEQAIDYALQLRVQDEFLES